MNKSLLLLLALILNAPVWGGQNPSTAAAAELEQQLGNITTYSAKFEQLVVDESGNLLDESAGEFELRRPDRFRWQVREPYSQLLLADGEALWVFDQDIDQVTVQDLDNGLGETPASLLSSREVTVGGDYAVSRSLDEDSGDCFYTLTPTSADAMFARLILIFAGDKLVELRVNDNLGQETYVHFSDIVLNPDLAADRFRFNTPEGVDLIDSRTVVISEPDT